MEFKRITKSALLRVAQYSGAEWIRDRVWAAFGRLPAAILTFHRVTDDIPEDPISISTSRFRSIVQAVRKDYNPIRLSELLDHMESGKLWPRRTVAITFDDGYRDNYECAAPILEDYGVPATFFVLANALGTELVLPWDEHLRGRISWMDWSQARELQSRGFEIGSHTLTHPNLGSTRGDAAWREISESKKKIEDTLGTAVTLFAYPFGRHENMIEENRNLVRKAGYRCCCSAFGGFVNLHSNPFDLWRIPVNRTFLTLDDLHFELRTGAPWRWLRPPKSSRALPPQR